MNIDPVELVAYCGGFCGQCGICSLNIQTGLDAVRNVVQAAGFRQEAQHLGWPLMRDIASHACAQFENQVDAFAQQATRFFPTHCRDGCVPGCAIAECCEDKGFATCAGCAEMETCETLRPAYATKHQNLREIQEMGVQDWAQARFEHVVAVKRQRLLDAVNRAFEQERTADQT